MYELTEENKINLKKLADYLTALPEDYSHFGMTHFWMGTNLYFGILDVSPDNYLNEYGTVACALGHGPAAGIEVGDSTDWFDYGNKFIKFQFGELIWAWCFSSFWTEIDNTPQGAAKRIYWILDGKEIPDCGDWEDFK